jgi:hypothetical protein
MREIEEKASVLTAEEREILAERLLATVNDLPVCDIDELCLEEAERRYAAWKTGHIHAIPEEEALRDIRGELNR